MYLHIMVHFCLSSQRLVKKQYVSKSHHVCQKEHLYVTNRKITYHNKRLILKLKKIKKTLLNVSHAVYFRLIMFYTINLRYLFWFRAWISLKYKVTYKRNFKKLGALNNINPKGKNRVLWERNTIHHSYRNHI